ncbi:hemolysin family protein [Marinilabilia rubra]|uniref:Hemolysin n=1 Tax=Marinilabilia rubra TaxID=2162893 RepID=A0A2U2BED6_9BACT|nr:hemolysin family protein [Marinilabilia rubra]PWE01418.1 hemolysin [Marinilabilia rubra]
MEYLPIIIVTIIFSAFFSGSEMAYLTANKLLIELNRKKNPGIAKMIDLFLRKPGMFITTILIGNNVALVVYGIYMAKLFEPMIGLYFSSDFAILLLQTILSTLVILITAEFIPKIIFRINPTFTLNLFSIPLTIFYGLFYPLSKFTLGISNFLIKKVAKTDHPTSTEDLVIGRLDFDHLLSKHQEHVSTDEEVPQEVKLLKNALDFSSVKIRECTIPRTDLEAVDVEDSMEVLRQKFIDSGHSKILVFKEHIDNIIGYIHVSELFKHPRKLRNIINPISIVPETMTANKLLEIFTKEHRSIALVVDEFGGTAGIVTLEDILEEIFGEIDDEHDVSDLEEKEIDKNHYHFSGRFEVDYLNEKYQLELPVSDEYETLAGMILSFNESIPKKGDEIKIEHFILRILEATSSKIELVELTKEDEH